MRKAMIVGVVSLCLLSFLSSGGFAQQAVKEVRIGVAGPMKAVFGRDHWRGASIAQEEINKAGGVSLGGSKVPIKLISVDTNEIASVSDAVVAVERAADEVHFFIGTQRSESALAMQDVAMKYKKIFMLCGAVHPDLLARVAKDYDKYKYTFRMTISSIFMGQALFAHLEDVAKIVKEQMGIAKPKAAILADKLMWADPIVKAVETKAPGMGLEVVGAWRPSATASDVTAELSAIKASGAQIIFQSVSGTMGSVLGKQWGELKIPAALVGGAAIATVKTFWDATGGYGIYSTTQTGIGPAMLSEKTMPFWNTYLKEFDDFPNYVSVTYDAVYVLKEAIERAGTIDSDKVVTELEKTDHKGAYGRIVFYPRGHDFPHDLRFGPGYNTWVINQWRGPGKVVVVWPYEWQGVKYEGSEKYLLPPWVVDYWKKKK
ncbi:MAG TPA: ABC transporter substrate-binding protein [Thermodesulfobacteriota bacterium]|nr:ABC transporter substrate-binding protein [Thermodesulfobacteriota bacterium]